MQSKVIREKFLEFFIEKKHQHQPPFPIINKDDPSLLFVNAGMNSFKEIFLGNQPISSPRVVTTQPCLRVSGKHNDLEAVGVDTYHHTLFEMLGNLSFGDYFKEEAIDWAWELLTEVYQLPKKNIYVTFFGGDAQDGLPKDEEAASIWAKYLPANHILAFGKEDNFWEMGEQGPCGPCSEIHLDIRPECERRAIPAARLVNRGHAQVIEIWNLVFMRYNRKESSKLIELQHKHIDTGMGFERLAMVLQGKTSNYDSDIFTLLIDKIEDISGKSYKQNSAVAMRVIADHIRAVAFAIADGQLPAHTKAGYVIRRILRRAIRYGYSDLALSEPFIYQLVPILADQMETIYPHLTSQKAYISQIIQAEEIAFLKTLAKGLHLFNHLDSRKIHQGVIDGGFAFELYDTYGFPLDLTFLIAKEKGLSIDEVGFQKALEAQKQRSKKDAAFSQGDWQILQPNLQPQFVGYDQLDVTTHIVQWRTLTNKIGICYQLVLAYTPFYPEGGGQVADTGVILAGQTAITVVDVQKEHGLILHTVHKLPQEIDKPVEARVDVVQRTLASSNHTTTHLLQAALRAILGTHVTQKGSLVRPNFLRFDFSYPTKLSMSQIEAIETMVNEKIRANIPCVERRSLPLAEAKAMNARALFGEKYGREVRVITFDPTYSIELCNGTHVSRTGEIGFFKIINESAIRTGVRRIKALTASHANHFVAEQLATLGQLETILKKPKSLVTSVENIINEQKKLHKQLAIYQAKAIEGIIQSLDDSLEKIDDLYLLIQVVEVANPNGLQQIALHYKKIYPKIAIVLATRMEQEVYLMLSLSRELGHNAHQIIQSIAPLIGGKGGGQLFSTMLKGNFPEGTAAALEAAKRYFYDTFDKKR